MIVDSKWIVWLSDARQFETVANTPGNECLAKV
jgi:hypothetical protein